ncbi:MAG: TIGR01212 family radical SAM protein [Salinivirgaceae bacterium]|nr:TIGR01212 family radical SAM protein [Salinivirgaceae bacterium]
MSEEHSFAWGTSRRFNDYSSFIKNKFGGRVQKISVNVGLSCPNRDGTKGTGGCIYCDNTAFTPAYCNAADSIAEQLRKGREFFSRKYPDMRYIAYFQSYTNTYAPVETLEALYREAVGNGIAGLIIGTRPDCINGGLLDMLARINQIVPVAVELGMESTADRTLELINRHHTWADSVKAAEMCASRGLQTGAHLILGLPGETEADFLEHARRVSALPLKTLKLHQLQIISGTPLAAIWQKDPDFVRPFTLNDYIATVVTFLEHLSPDIVVERFVSVSPAEKVIAPRWNRMKNFEVVALIDKELERRGTWQGRLR